MYSDVCYAPVFEPLNPPHLLINWSRLPMFMKAITLLIALASPLFAQEQHYFTPIAKSGQFLRGSAYKETGAVGFNGNKVGLGFSITSVEPGSPAARAGLQVGDVITAVRGKGVKSLSG